VVDTALLLTLINPIMTSTIVRCNHLLVSGASTMKQLTNRANSGQKLVKRLVSLSVDFEAYTGRVWMAT
jgi:hypothetical protein